MRGGFPDSKSPSGTQQCPEVLPPSRKRGLQDYGEREVRPSEKTGRETGCVGRVVGTFLVFVFIVGT